jgi:hypothetical protein
MNDNDVRANYSPHSQEAKEKEEEIGVLQSPSTAHPQ